jgi:dipeptidyl aminopeptidase/acylaminoacyl peptidase
MPNHRPALRSGLALAILALFPPPAVPQAQRPFTVDQILSAPFPSELVVASSGAMVAWASYERGLRNIHVAGAPAFTPRRLTSYGEDDGQELTNLAFSGDDAFVVYARGGDHGANWAAEGGLAPNPSSSPVQPEVQVWAAPVAGGEPVLVGEGDEPVPAPGSRLVAFVRGGQIWTGEIGGAPSRLFFARGRNGSPAWSPDGRVLAFVSDRDDHSFIGIYSGPGEPVRYLAPGISRDTRPVWSPDGRRVAFIRQPGRGGASRPPLEQVPQPWAIWVADARTSEAREVWRSGESLADSIPRTLGGPNLNWAEGHRLVFLSYDDGWPHLYSAPADGSAKPLLLTPGRFMVESVAMAPDRRSVLYNANAGSDPHDIDRRHLFRVPVDRAEPTALSAGTGIEWSPHLTADGSWLVYLASDAHRAAMPKARPVGGGDAVDIMEAQVPAAFPAGRLVVPEPVVVKSPDGLDIHCQLFRPPGAPVRRPAIVFVHGGPPRQMLLGWHYGFYYSNTYALNQYLASRGFLVLSVNYRLGIGYGHAFQYPERAGTRGASEYLDVLAAGRYLRSRPDVDPKRVGIYGGSYGGYLTALALGRNSDVFAAGVDIHGVHNRVRLPPDELRAAAVVGDGLAEEDVRRALRVAWESSPVSSVATWRSPVLLLHGDDDRNVEFGQTIDLARRLATRGVRVEEIVIPDDIHDFLLHRNWVRVGEATGAFFERHFGVETSDPRS